MELEWSANVERAASVTGSRQFKMPTDGFVSVMGCLTAFVNDTTMAPVKDDEVIGSRQAD
jgi:hypothetical protein